MIDRRDKDDGRVAQIRRGIRAENRRFWSLLVAFLIISAIFAGILQFHLPLETGGIAALAVLLVWIGFMFRNLGTVPSAAEPYDEEILRRTIDDQHRRWRWIYTFVFIVVGGLAAMITGLELFLASHHLPKSGPMVSVLVVVADLAFFAVTAAFQVCFGPGFLTRAHRRALNDEHTRAMQHSAAMFGYLLCVILMCAVLAIVAIQPQWGLVIMPGAIAAAVILPGLYFLMRQWRAEHDG
jgi:hypothetical protein